MDGVPTQGLTDTPNESSLNLELNFAWSQVALLPMLLALSSLSSYKHGLLTQLSGVLRTYCAPAGERCHMGTTLWTLCCPFNSQQLWSAQDWEPSWSVVEMGRNS